MIESQICIPAQVDARIPNRLNESARQFDDPLVLPRKQRLPGH
jgi:hypothetical protein